MASGRSHVSDKTIETVIKLIANICKRNGIKKLLYSGDLKGNLCIHCWVAASACLGTYLKTMFKCLANEANKTLEEKDVPFLVKVTISDLYIWEGHDTNCKNNGFIKPGIYTMVGRKVIGESLS